MQALLAILLLANSLPVAAEWIRAGEHHTAIHYIDPATISKNGDLRSVWQMVNQKQENKSGVASSRALMEYNCKDKRFRFISYSEYAEPMTKGKVLESDSSTDWYSVPPDSITAKHYKFVCSL